MNGKISKAIRATGFLFVNVLVFGGCILSAQPADKAKEAQQPSLSETETWITQTFAEGGHKMSKAIQEIGFIKSDDADQCYMQYAVSEQTDADVRVMQLINLIDVDPSSIKSGQPIHSTELATNQNFSLVNYSTVAVQDHPYVFVTIRTTDNRKTVVSYTYWKENGTQTKHSNMEYSVGFSDLGVAVEAEYAPRFIQALRHAVELCGGKPSSFQ